MGEAACEEPMEEGEAAAAAVTKFPVAEPAAGGAKGAAKGARRRR